MLQIRLSRGPSAETGGGTKSLPVETVTVACPDHLVLADLPVAKSLGSVTAGSLVKTVGRRSRRHLGERVHFCVRCDFPIAIYGRLSPCEHAFCLDCARSDSICYLCDDRIQKIQTIKMMEGIFICAAPHCLKSFLKKTDFESHIHENHANLLQPNMEKDDGNESEAQSVIKQSTASESSIKAPIRPPVFSPSTHSQPQRSQPREPSHARPMTQSRPAPHFEQGQSQPSEGQADSRPPGFERRAGPQNRFSQQGVDVQGGLQQESGKLSDKQQDVSSDTQFPSFPTPHPQQPQNFAVPIHSNPPFSYPNFPPDGAQPLYGAPESGSGQGSLLGFPPGPFPESFQRPWNAVPSGLPLEPPLNGQGIVDASADSQRGGAFFPGDYGRSPMNPSPSPLLDKGMERQGSNVMDPQSMLPPPPPLPPPQASQVRVKPYSGDMGRDGAGYGWQRERRDSFGSGRD